MSVYIVNDSNHNFKEAEKFGRLIVLTCGSINIFNTDKLESQFREKLSAFNPKEDYLLLSGSPVLNILAYKAILNNSSYNCQVLIYDFVSKDYKVRRI